MLRPIKDTFSAASFPDLLIGLREPDDAAVWRLDEDRAIVVTTDFFTPVVDNAYDYGSIAAANSLSDVYAMGGQPFLALNVAALPDDLPDEISSEIIRGGAEKAREAGVVIAGGHTVKDKEPKYGLVVIGFVDPRKMLSKGGLKVGDALVLTKPLGFGVTTTALKREQADAQDVAEAVGWMKQLNKTASQLANEFESARRHGHYRLQFVRSRHGNGGCIGCGFELRIYKHPFHFLRAQVCRKRLFRGRRI